MELIRPIIRLGNSAGVILPREFLHGRAKIEIITKPINIRKDVLEILGPYMEKIIGAHLYGSRARNEEEEDSDVDLLVIANEKIKIKKKGWEIIVLEEKNLDWAFKNHPIMMYSIISEAKPIINSISLNNLKEKYKPRNEHFKYFINETKRIAKINEEDIEIDKKISDTLILGNAIAYSLILRLRGIYIMKMLIEKSNYSHQQFKSWLIREAKINKKDLNLIYSSYKIVKNDKKKQVDIPVNIAEKLLELLKKEIEKYD